MGIPQLSLADELSAAINENQNLSHTSSNNYLNEQHNFSLHNAYGYEVSSITKEEYNADHVTSSNSKEGCSDSSLSVNSFTESVSPPPLCPITSLYSSSDNAPDRFKHHSPSNQNLSTPEPNQPWLNHIPKHYSLDYDFSDDWDLVIAGTTAATGLSYLFSCSASLIRIIIEPQGIFKPLIRIC